MSGQGLARGYYNCQETPEPVELQVSGDFPSWLSGVLFRTGPGTFTIPLKGSQDTFYFRHWFDGLTLHHRFEIDNGKVTYRSRKGASAVEEYIEKVGIHPIPNFAQSDPCEKALGKFMTRFQRIINSTPYPTGPSSDNVGVTLTANFTGFAQSPTANQPSLVAKTDANRLQYLDPITLEPLLLTSYESILDELNGPISASHVGFVDGELYNFNLSLGKNTTYKIFKVDGAGKGKVLAEITDAPAAYIHTTFATKRFVILVVWQADYDLGIDSVLLEDLSRWKKWDKNRKTKFYVIDRLKGGIVGRYESEPFFAFHCINAYDDSDGSIVLDIAVYENHDILDKLVLKNLRRTDHEKGYLITSFPRRFRLSAPSESTADTWLEAKIDLDLGVENNIELPTISPHVSCGPYRYTYGIHQEGNIIQSIANSIVKIDLETKTRKVWSCEGSVPGEPIFVASGEKGGKEDDGVLLTVVLDGKKQTSALVVLDAETMKERARAEINFPLPYGFHGTFTQ